MNSQKMIIAINADENCTTGGDLHKATGYLPGESGEGGSEYTFKLMI